MNRTRTLLLALGALTLFPLAGQIAETTISSDPPGGEFFVDGARYQDKATFRWPTGSKHQIWAAAEYGIGNPTNSRWTFVGWRDSAGLLATGSSQFQTITAHPDITDYTASFSVTYRVDFLFANFTGLRFPNEGDSTNAIPCPIVNSYGTSIPPTLPPGVPGALFISGVCYANSVSIWYPLGTNISLNAFPIRGYVFEGWQVNGIGPTNAFMRTYSIREHTVLSPRFVPAKTVSFYTQPHGFSVSVDGAVIPTVAPDTDLPDNYSAGVLDFADGSSHILGAPSPQMDNQGRLWVFDSFSNGLGQGGVYKAVGANIPDTIVARFVRGVTVSLLTSPVGLPLTIDGRAGVTSGNFVWGVGTRHTVSAPAENIDSTGRKYTFQGWSNGGSATQELVAPADAADAGLRLIANYDRLPRTTISSAQPGIVAEVDGKPCPLPCTLDRPAGASAVVTLPQIVELGPNSQARFLSWDGASGNSRTIQFAGDEVRINAVYRVFHRLVAVADPEDGATFRYSPSSPDGFFLERSTVEITVVPREGFKFRRWGGDLTSTLETAPLQLDRPRLVRALLDKSPTISSAGVRNAAGETPGRELAAGSVISIFGVNFASDYFPGPASPLVQTLGNVTVRVGARLLPLLFVSPEQINAVLPSDLSPGEHSLFVRNANNPEVEGRFTVARNAPGLFGSLVDNRVIASAMREDGSIVSTARPARRGERLTLLGTGLGPYARPIFDGFVIPAAPPNALADRADILYLDTVLAPEFAGAAPGFVGLAAVRFTVPESWPQATAVELRVRVNGVSSNSVWLPLE
jgi:uncharacterized protein (TIGR03437 family)